MVHIVEKIKEIPEKPGVYMMKDETGQIIYVGKARLLRSRVKQYFQQSSAASPKTRSMVDNIWDFDYIFTDSEVEALVLECNLIKKHRPRYNVIFKDDKSYPYIKVTISEYFPRVFLTRKVAKDGSKYFGPFTDVGSVKETLNVLKKIFPVRNCRKKIGPDGIGERPCLNYHIKRCIAPCQGAAGIKEYGEMIKDICTFLRGGHSELVSKLKKEMEYSAQQLDFEKASVIRDRIKAVEKIWETQKVVSTDFQDRDIIAFARQNSSVCVQMFFVRGGKIVENERFMLKDIKDSPDDEVVASFIKQFYTKAAFIPGEILVPCRLEDGDTLSAWLNDKKGGRVYIRNPKRGEKHRLINMAQKNAAVSLEQMMEWMEKERERTEGALQELCEHLNLKGAKVHRIEAFDISNIQGVQPTASMVVFVDGKPEKKDYRRFRIRTVQGPDDFASMAEVVFRRYKRGLEEKKSYEDKFGILPDLILVDGGKGQLNAAIRSLKSLGITDIPVMGVAKENEEIFIMGRNEPLVLPGNSQALHLIQRIRDEAHRFAVTYHRSLRNKNMLKSVLDDIEGIGVKRKKALLKHFLNVDNIKKAELIELKAVKGMDKKTAENVFEYFKKRY